MRLQDVLSSVPGLEKRFVHYLESQGYISPAKLQKARIARRDYSEADRERIRAFWAYYQRGISVQRAYELLARAAVDGAYVFFPAPVRRWREALNVLRQLDNVAEAAAVYGVTANVVARVRTPHESDLHAVLDRLLEDGIIDGLPEIYRFAASAWSGDEGGAAGGEAGDAHGGCAEHPERAQRDERDERGGRAGRGKTMRAWVLIKVPAKQIGGLVDELRSYPGVVEASAVYGETDVIAKIEVPDQDALDELVLERIQSIEAVDSTRTFIAVGNLHWRRD